MIEIPKAAASNTWLDDGPYWRGALLDGERSAMVSCDSGHVAFLGDHAIAADGTVTPSLVCPEKGCTWHVFGRLAGWTP